MVRTLTGLQGVIETEDASDALAVAICHATTTFPRAAGLRGSVDDALLVARGSCAGLGAREPMLPRVTYTKSFPGSEPAYMAITVDKDGAVTYREAKDEDPETFKLEPDVVQRDFRSGG